MIVYVQISLAVTIDTNIFDAAKFDLCDASPLKTLENYVKNGKIKVVLSDIVVRDKLYPLSRTFLIFSCPDS